MGWGNTGSGTKSSLARSSDALTAAKKAKREERAAEASAAPLPAASPDEGSPRDQPSANQGCALMDWCATDAAALATSDAALDASTVAPADRTRGAATEGHAPGEAPRARQLPSPRAAQQAPAASAALSQTVASHLLQRYTNRFLSDYNLHLALQLQQAVRLTLHRGSARRAARMPAPASCAAVGPALTRSPALRRVVEASLDVLQRLVARTFVKTRSARAAAAYRR